MTEPDTTALRALADANAPLIEHVCLDPATVRALCDGYDEAQRLRAQVARVGSCAQCGGWWLDRACGPTHAAVQAVAEHPVEVYAERDAARQALADLIGELRGLCARLDDQTLRTTGAASDALRSVIDRYDPEVK